jgi:subtilisin-like proprotein convertase family protein
MLSHFGKLVRTSTGRRTPKRLRLEFLESRQMMAIDSLQITSQLTDSHQLLVQFRNSDPAALVGQNFAGARVARQLTDDGWYRVDVGSNVPLTQALTAFQNRSDVIQATPDFSIKSQAMPNDTSFGSLWGLSNSGAQGGVANADINATRAWEFGTSSSIVTAVIDTGVDYRHQDLAANIWSNTDEVADNGIDDDRNGYVDDVRGWDFANNDKDPMDDNGHGTHVAGTIGAVGNNGIGVSGVAWSSKIMPLKFLDRNGSGALSDAIEAISYARVNGAKIINASWGGGGFSGALQSAITQFQSAGGIFVAAAGNESSNNVTTHAYPANYTNVISVGASTRNDTLASFSNYGTNVQIVAPGQSILSTLPNNSYGSLSGTSMAAPHVAGALALLWGQNPTLTAAQITSALLNNTDNVLRGAQSIYGRLDVGRAAEALRQISTPTTNPPTTNPPTNNPTVPQPVKRTYGIQGSYPLRDATRTNLAAHRFSFDVTDDVTIADMDVILNIQHSYASDLTVRLIAPDGTSRTLINRRGGATSNIQVTLSDEATANMSFINPLRGAVRAETSLSAFDGKNARGRWTIQITDNATGDVGSLLAAQLVITPRATPPTSASQSVSTSTGLSAERTNLVWNNSFAQRLSNSVFGSWLRASERSTESRDPVIDTHCDDDQDESLSVVGRFFRNRRLP